MMSDRSRSDVGETQDGACGAKTRKGTPCKRRDLYGNGRCRLHGGLSTGPLTDAGKQQSRINGMKGGRPRKTRPHAILTNPDSIPVDQGTGKTEPHEMVTNGDIRRGRFNLPLNEIERT